LKKQNEETDAKLNNLEQYSRRCCPGAVTEGDVGYASPHQT